MDATAEKTPDSEGQAESNGVAPQTDSTRPVGELFRYSSWAHIGQDAEECDERESGSCGDPRHFHAWCRLPNQFQHQDIRERALAAKARRIRQLRDPETDAHVILEADLAEIRSNREAIVDELVAKEWWKRHLDAMADVEERDEYEHIEKDRERLAELQALDESKRPKDEFSELERYFAGYNKAVDDRRTERERPVREAVEGLDDAALLSQLRDDRVAAEGSAAFMDTYAKWQWFAGTHFNADPLARVRRFTSVDELEEAAPEIVEGLRALFGNLETSLQRGSQGN